MVTPRFFIFTPKTGEMIQFDSCLSNELKPPTRKACPYVWGGNAEAWSFESVTFLEAPICAPRPGHKDSHLGFPKWPRDVDMMWSCFGCFVRWTLQNNISSQAAIPNHKTLRHQSTGSLLKWSVPKNPSTVKMTDRIPSSVNTISPQNHGKNNGFWVLAT